MPFFDENIYREPSIEECQNGLLFELYTHKWEWVSGYYPYVLDLNKELDEFGKDYEMKLVHAITRVKK